LQSSDQLLKSALAHRPELLQARLELVLADRQAARAAAERVPDLRLGPAVGARGRHTGRRPGVRSARCGRK